MAATSASTGRQLHLRRLAMLHSPTVVAGDPSSIGGLALWAAMSLIQSWRERITWQQLPVEG
jgi:hypothetical protein